MQRNRPAVRDSRPGARAGARVRGAGHRAASCRASICAPSGRAVAGARRRSRARHPGQHAHRPVARSASPAALPRARQPFRERSAIMPRHANACSLHPAVVACAAALAATPAAHRRRLSRQRSGIAAARAPVVPRPRLPAGGLRRIRRGDARARRARRRRARGRRLGDHDDGEQARRRRRAPRPIRRSPRCRRSICRISPASA